MEVHGQRFEIYTMISEIHENVDMVSGMKKIVELKADIDTSEL